MASKKQIAANQANAERSTGPKSQLGKARSRLNARTHGLTAKHLLVGDEDEASFNELRAELMEQHHPQAPLEAELVDRLAGILWRLRRVPFFEAAILDARQAQLLEADKDADHDGSGPSDSTVQTPHSQWRSLIGRALLRDGVYGDALGKLARHETTLMNAFTKTLQMLLLLQNNRATDEGASLLIGSNNTNITRR
jgi:hypothetical protein